MRIALVLTPFNDTNLHLAAQVGTEDIVHYDMNGMPGTLAEFRAIRRRVEKAGMRLSVVEGGPRMDQIVVPKPGRDAQIEEFKRSLDRMGAGGTLAGAVRTAAGVPVEGASIHLVDSGGRAVSQISLVTSSSDGSYAVNPALRPGTYDARAEKEGYAPATLRVTIRAGETAPADFTLLRGGRIDVVVVRAGERVEGAMVSLLDADGRPVTRGLTLHNIFSLGRDRTDRDGRITLESVAAGPYTIRPQKGHPVTSPTPVEAIESGTTPIELALPE